MNALYMLHEQAGALGGRARTVALRQLKLYINNAFAYNAL